ncbi:MAG: insulinase family protein [Gammaproteobacteria bacterium]|nr:insulinase family protein [Gammaproteobacteria bacterium]
MLGLLAIVMASCTTMDMQDAPPAVLELSKLPSADYSSYLNRPPLLPDYTRVVLDNGAVLLLLEKPEVPLVGFEVVIRGGSTADPVGKAGTAYLLADLLSKGAGNFDAAQFAAVVEGLGGDISAGAGQESLQARGSFLSRDAATGVSLLADLLVRPKLDEDELIKLRDRTVQFIKAAKEGSPNQLLSTYAKAFVYGDHPYAHASFGSEQTLAQIGIDDVRDYYAEQVGADRMIISVTGDFDTDQMISLLRDAFGNWRPAAASLPQYESAESGPGGRVLLIDKPDATQTYFWLGNIGVSKYFPQRAGLALANAKFGGSFGSMLNTALRVESGLTYGAGSSVSQPRMAGTVSISSFTRTETTVAAIDLALETLASLHSDGIDADGLASIKAYLLGQFPLAFETAPQLARQMAQLEFYGLETDYINAYGKKLVQTDLPQIAEVIDTVFPQPDEMVLVMIGNAAAIRSDIKKYGSVTEKKITDPTFN